MHILGLIISAVIAFFWIFYGLQVAYGSLRIPWIKDFAAADDEHCPRLSLIFAARDEAEKLPAALSTLALLDYPNLEIIAVDDRSTDGTVKLLDDFAQNHARLRVIIHIKELPAGWLGKTHALYKAYEIATGDWLLFTDADVRFAPDVLRRAIALAQARELDHLTLFGDLEMHGFWEKVLISFFGLIFHLTTDPYQVSNPHSRCYAGVGAFQLIKRSAYESIGTHRRLALEVVEDMRLGKLVKEGGFRSSVGVAQEAVALRWHAGLGNLIRGVTKNFFAGVNYSWPLAALVIIFILLFNVGPFFAAIFGHGWIRIFGMIAAVIALCFHAGVDIVMRISPLYAFTHPLGAVFVSYMLLRSAVVTLRQGGIEWRGTFYRLGELKERRK